MNIKSVHDYFPGMNIIDSDIKEKVKRSYENVKDTSVSRADVLSSLKATNPDEKDLYNLLSDEAGDLLEVMGGVAKEKRIRYFGNNVCLFSPIYIANYCENSCKYCGFRAKSPIKRAKLNYDEIEEEMRALAETGIEDVLILFFNLLIFARMITLRDTTRRGIVQLTGGCVFFSQLTGQRSMFSTFQWCFPPYWRSACPV